MTFEDGEYIPDEADELEEVMLDTATQYLDTDLNDDQRAAIRLLLRPVAQMFADLQEDIGLVLASSQIDNAGGEALDLLTALIGVRRETAKRATGEVTFSRSNTATKDYPIPMGTTVQTDSLTPVRFETVETAVISEGDTQVSGVSVEAQEGGTESNVGADTLTVMPDSPNGIEAVTNPQGANGGADEETDDALRERAKTELANGSAATAAALISTCMGVDGVLDVTIFINDTDTENHYGNGLPPHSFELVVYTGGDEDVQQEVGQAILDTKAAGDYSVAGQNGVSVEVTGRLPNGQQWDIGFSESQSEEIYIDVSLTKTKNYIGDDEVRDSIVEYIGGLRSDGSETEGTGTGEDVVYNTIINRIMSVGGVHDIEELYIGTSESPTGTSNIAIDSEMVALTDATDGSITISTSDY